MSSYFTLTLDTTPPGIEITAPWYTTIHADTHIYIIANETLDIWQEIYIIDSAGQRHDFIFVHQGDRLYGVIKFSQVAQGIATIYARVRDTVHNVSALMSKAIEIKAGAKVFIFTAEAARAVGADEAVRGIGTAEATRQIDVEVR